MIKNSATTVDINNLRKNLGLLKASFKKAKPYKHVVIDNFLKEEVADQLLREFPSLQDMYSSSAFSGVAEKRASFLTLRRCLLCLGKCLRT